MPLNRDPLHADTSRAQPAGPLVVEPAELERLATDLDALHAALSLPVLDRAVLSREAVGHPGLAIALCHCVDQWDRLARELAQHTAALAAQLRTTAGAYRDSDTTAVHTLVAEDAPRSRP